MRFLSTILILLLAATVYPQEPTKGVFVAVGHYGTRMISADGRTWSNPILGKEGETYRGIRFLNGVCLVVGSYGGSNHFAVSNDGIAWKTGQRDAKYVNYVRCLTANGDLFLTITGDAGGGGIPAKCSVSTSTDGLTWTEPTPIDGKAMLRRAVFGKGRFVAVGDLGRRSVSFDGKKWQDAPGTKTFDTLVDVAFGNDTFVGVGLHGLRMSSKDGLEWTPRQVGEEGEHLNSVLWTGERFVAIGQGATYFSPDGSIWTREKNENAPTVATYGNGLFVGARWRGRLLASRDAVHWDEISQSKPSPSAR